MLLFPPHLHRAHQDSLFLGKYFRDLHDSDSQDWWELHVQNHPKLSREAGWCIVEETWVSFWCCFQLMDKARGEQGGSLYEN